MTEIRVDDCMVDLVEHNMTPPMRQLVTIPISDDVAIYVSTSPFTGFGPTTDAQLVELSRRIVRALRREFHDANRA